jgi:hypothetical protein
MPSSPPEVLDLGNGPWEGTNEELAFTALSPTSRTMIPQDAKTTMDEIRG